MFEQQRDHCIARRISVGLQSEFSEALVLAHQLGNRPLEARGDLFERRTRRRMFQIFYSVELDTAALEQFKRAARVPSAGVVI